MNTQSIHLDLMLKLFSTLVLSLAIPALHTSAHQIESALRYLDNELELQSHFSNGEPAQGAVVRLIESDGSSGQELGRTNENGQAILDISTLKDGYFDIQVDCGPGHKDYLEIPLKAGKVIIDNVVQSPIRFIMLSLMASLKPRID